MVNRRYSHFIIILLCATLGIALSNQGWKEYILGFDLLPYAKSASQFFLYGKIIERGVLTSYQSFTPPGIAYLMLPGVLIFDDPRLFEIVGASLTYFGTLIGIWLLAKQAMSKRCAIFAVIGYALSGQGLFFARSLWPRAHPFFFVWMTYWILHWVKQRDGRFLATAILTWAIGLYMFLEIAPAMLIFPAIWLRYRPPITLRSLAIAGAVILLIWLPYLRFEYHRDFVDVRSQIFRQPLATDDERATWCDPTLPLETWPEQAAALPSTQAGWWFPHATNLFQRAWNRLYWTAHYAGDRLVWTKWWNGVNNFKMAYQHAIPIALLWFGLTNCIAIRCVITGIRHRQRVEASSLIALCLIVPWLILWIITDAGRADRFWWLWPLQAMFLAAFFTDTLNPIVRSKRIAVMCQVAMLVLTVTQPRVFDKIAAWQHDGWSGTDHERIQASNLLARQLRTAGISQAAIGYQVLMYGWEPEFHRHDPQYKVGADFDFYLQRKHGIINTNRCAEGIAPFDDYRIVQTARTTDLNRYLHVHDWDKYEPIGEIGAYRIMKRKEQAE